MLPQAGCLREERAKHRYCMGRARIRGRCFSSVMLRGVGRGRVAQVVRLGRPHEVSESNPPKYSRNWNASEEKFKFIVPPDTT